MQDVKQSGKQVMLCALPDPWLLPELAGVVDGYLRDGADEEILIRCGALLYLPTAPKSEWIVCACQYGQLDLKKSFSAPTRPVKNQDI